MLSIEFVIFGVLGLYPLVVIIADEDSYPINFAKLVFDLKSTW